jgi:tRNA threonylcarbamoyladenosine biosynthesis protein TsaB
VRGNLVLAWDTATAVTTLALCEIPVGGPVRTLSARRGDGSASHSVFLPPLVRDVLAEHGLRPKDLDLLAAGRGPGSFTGLRTGLALAKGLAMGAGVPLVGVGSLDTLAAGLTASFSPGSEAAPAVSPDPASSSAIPPVSAVSPDPAAPPCAPLWAAPLIDARHGEIFTALYRLDPPPRPGQPAPEPVRLSDPEAVRPDSLFARLSDLAPAGVPIALVGPALALVPEIRPPFRAGDCRPPRAEVLAALAAGRRHDAADHPPEPIYGRSPDIFKKWTPPARLAARQEA